MTVKTYRLGNSIVVTVPALFNIGENVEYQPIIDENGVISLLPVKHHIFRGDNDIPIGREDAWHE